MNKSVFILQSVLLYFLITNIYAQDKPYPKFCKDSLYGKFFVRVYDPMPSRRLDTLKFFKSRNYWEPQEFKDKKLPYCHMSDILVFSKSPLCRYADTTDFLFDKLLPPAKYIPLNYKIMEFNYSREYKIIDQIPYPRLEVKYGQKEFYYDVLYYDGIHLFLIGEFDKGGHWHNRLYVSYCKLITTSYNETIWAKTDGYFNLGVLEKYLTFKKIPYKIYDR